MKRHIKCFILLGVIVVGVVFLFYILSTANREFFSLFHFNLNEQNYGTIESINSHVQRTKKLQKLLNCCNRPLEWKIIRSNNFWIMRNVFHGAISGNISCAEAITYTTIGDFSYLNMSSILVKRWQAPISFALHAPGYDFGVTMNAIQYSRHCLPESELIRSFVSFHLFFPSEHTPDYVPHTPEEALRWPFDCQVPPPPYSNLLKVQQYKRMANLTFPINVARNIARQAANTHFILASDVELFPSPNLSDMFLEMVSFNESVLDQGGKPRVYAVPVFEIEFNATLPTSKPQLMEMLAAQQAIPFHINLCKECHSIPEQDKWYQLNNSNTLTVIAVAKREGLYRMWEPFYISENREPLFDERISWEAMKDKRIQNYAMCLLNYEYHILHPAFLVHNPGIKTLQLTKKRNIFVKQMDKQIKDIIGPEYRKLYGTNINCQP